MKVTTAITKLAKAARGAHDRSPESTARYALSVLYWVPMNVETKGRAFNAGFIHGLAGMAAKVAQLPPAVSEALFIMGEALTYDGDVPGDQVEECCAALDALFVPEPA